MSHVQTYGIVGISALLHFLVDGLCVCCLYLMVCPFDASQFVGYFILYNVLAFLTQPLTGYMVDRLRHKHWVLLASVLLLTLATMITIVLGLSSNFSPPFREGLGEGLLLPFREGLGAGLLSVLLGLGNSLFHVWGGQQVAVHTGNDIRSLGVFVSTGAFGLAVGAVFFSWWLLFGFLLAICLLAIVAVRTLPHREGSGYTQGTVVGNRPVSSLLHSEGLGVGLLLLIISVVALRSWLCEDLTSDITRTQTMVLLLGFTAMLGKAAGGFLCKWLGLVWAVVLMVVATAVSYFLPSYLFTFLPLFFVNCTMPVTLWLANLLLPRREGLAFGLLAAALMPCYLLTDFALGAYAVPLVGTIVIELGVLYFLRERRSRVLWASVVINVLTNLPLNLLIRHGWLGDLPSLLIAEAVIVVVESLCYLCLVRRWRQAFIYGLLCNAVSFLVGLLFQFLYMIIY